MSEIVTLITKKKERNIDVIECLESWLELAKAGEIAEVAIAGVSATGDSTIGYSKDAAVTGIICGLELVKHDLLNLFNRL